MISVGEIAPAFKLAGTAGSKKQSIDLEDPSIAGHFILLLFVPPKAIGELNRYQTVAASLADHSGLTFAISPGAQQSADLAFPLLVDSDGRVFAAYGIDATLSAPVGVLLAPNHHICVVASSAMTLADDVTATLDRLVGRWRPREADIHPPVLIVPDVFSAEDCRRLISVYRMQGNVFVEPGHGDPGMTTDYKMRIPEYGRHDRVDHWIVESETNRMIDERLQHRLFPEIHKVFQYRITRRERYRIGCYEGARGGDPNGHRDNTEPGVAHRRFAVSINLNTDAFSGGEIQFLEFGGHRYRPESGAAIVFSSSLLHEILEVSAGRRYVLLAFLYGDT
ncbi:MAG: 2OG-Fe(II) oxygenase [Proteobacteria bacterium]|nr:2OG-Fe(II) oxygenase [Pseudomonadota bacterium]